MANTLPRLRVTVAEARAALGLGKTTFYGRVKQGKLNVQKDGGKTFVTVAELKRYVEACEKDQR